MKWKELADRCEKARRGFKILLSEVNYHHEELERLADRDGIESILPILKKFKGVLTSAKESYPAKLREEFEEKLRYWTDRENKGRQKLE